MSLGAKLDIAALIQQSLAGGLSNTLDTINFKKSYTLTNGAGLNQANLAWSDRRAVSASATDSLDLAGTLVDVFGNTITFTEIKGIIIYADSENGDTLNIGGNDTAGFNSWVGAAENAVVLKPDGLFMLLAPDADGYAVTATTADLFDITNNDSAAASYDIILIGTAS